MGVNINNTVELERRASFILFDLGALNILGGAGAVWFHSVFLGWWGFRASSILAGLFFITLGLFAGRLSAKQRRVSHWVYVAVLLLHISGSFSALSHYERAFGVMLVQLSFVLPSVSALYLLVRNKVRGAGTEAGTGFGPGVVRQPRARRGLALLSSMLLSVGCGLGLLLAFFVYPLPAILNSPNPYVNLYHDFVVIPAILLCFPAGLMVGEGLWLCLGRVVSGGKGTADYVRYLSQIPLVGRRAVTWPGRPERGGGSAPMVTPRTNHALVNQANSGVEASGRHTLGGLFVPGAALLVLVCTGAVCWFYFLAPERRGTPQPRALVQVAADAVVVSQQGDAPYRTIQAAIDAAQPGADILVRPGVYAERVLLDRAVNLVGDTSGGEAVVVECSDGSCLRASARGASVKNFHLRPAAGFWRRLVGGGGDFPLVEISEGNLLLESCVVSSGGGMGIVVHGEDTRPRLKGLKVHDMGLNGILFTGGSGGVLEGSDVSDTGWAALRVEQGSQPLIVRSKFHHSRMSGIMFAQQGAGQVEGCDVYENGYANIDVKEQSLPVIRQTRVFGGSQGGVFFRGGSSGLLEECDIYGNALSGIEVAEGSSPLIRRTKSHHGRSVGVYIHKEGNGLVEDSLVYENRGAGIQVAGGSRPTFRNTTVRANGYSGFEIVDGADPLIEGCRIYGGEMSGISIYRGGRGRIVKSDIHSNRMANIALRDGARPSISNSKIHDGWQAGVLAVEGGSGTVEQCEITNNLIGVEITNGGNLAVGGSKIMHNKHQGVTVGKGGFGSISGSDLRRNGRGPWLLGEGASVDKADNVE